MSKLTILNDPKDICLSVHGVIEAHAGTGKTYTIVQMVLRILQEAVVDTHGKPVLTHIREILLVTFTEKAAGELKRRIREGLESRLHELKKSKPDNGKPLIDHLEDCLNNIHEALIGTIHGVCLRLLQTWPFETGVQFKTEIVDDSEGLESALRESMRIDWQDPETCLPWAMEQLLEHGKQLDDAHYRLVRDMARELLDTENAVLDRRAVGNRSLSDVADILNKLDAEISGHRTDFECALKSLIDSLRETQSCGKLEPDRLALLNIRLPQLQNMIESGKPDINILEDPCKVGRSGIYTRPHLKKITELAGVDNCAQRVSNHSFLPLLKQRMETVDGLLLTMLCDAAILLRDRWIRIKNENGSISYQDMLRLMLRAVQDNPGFCSSLRGRLRYGIIDEFQDTSILQWKIFNRIFLETSEDTGPRLFIVGDPKQSIYSFQGADVQSYLDAKSAIENNNGQTYGLINNFRSLPETIDAYNVILGRETTGAGDNPDWFGFDESAVGKSTIFYPYEGECGGLARPPSERTIEPRNRIDAKTVQVMVLEGNAGRRRWDMAQWVSRVIRSLAGTTISIPNGLDWSDIKLDYSDFAVIVETHRLAEPFLECFRTEGIPAVKYKMEGVFQSAIARDLRVLLLAIAYPGGDTAPRLSALLTRFFNYHPANIQPQGDLDACNNPAECGHGKSCLFHALEAWKPLAEKRRWSQLFSSILERTNVRERLIGLIDGERHLADLRQVIDYCIEKLYCGNYGLRQLVEHLGRLLAEEESAGQDRNLYTLSTDKSSVRVLTMHAAKGLEFPVVFAVTGGSGQKARGMGMLNWIAGDHKKHVMPVNSFAKGQYDGFFENDMENIRAWGVEKQQVKRSDGKTCDSFFLGIFSARQPVSEAQRTRERRRLLYVALTRAKAMLFVPAHVQKIENKPSLKSIDVDWAALSLPHSPDRDLTPVLLHLLDQKKIERFDYAYWKRQRPEATEQLCDYHDPAWVVPDSVRKASQEIYSQIRGLNLPARICRQTSYTELSRKVTSDRLLDRSEGDDEVVETVAARGEQLPATALPRGKKTGDALHLALEDLFFGDRIDVLKATPEWVEKYLDQNGILRGLDAHARQNAVKTASSMLRSAITAGYDLPTGETVNLSALPGDCRSPEMEFTLSMDSDWIHGYMDLVFRIECQGAQHPWRYFVLDWKSDSLCRYEKDTVEKCIVERHYELQAKIYCHALDRYLKGILQKIYDPGKNLGGALYVFLRSFDADQYPEQAHYWTRRADPAGDALFAQRCIQDL